MRIEGLEDDLAERLVTARCRLLLDGPAAGDDPAAFLLGAAELARLGQPAAASVGDVGGVAEVAEVAEVARSPVGEGLRAARPWSRGTCGPRSTPRPRC